MTCKTSPTVCLACKQKKPVIWKEFNSSVVLLFMLCDHFEVKRFPSLAGGVCLEVLLASCAGTSNSVVERSLLKIRALAMQIHKY